MEIKKNINRAAHKLLHRRLETAVTCIQRKYKNRFMEKFTIRQKCQRKIEIMERYFSKLRLKLYEDSQIKIAYYWRRWRKRRIRYLVKSKKSKERKRYKTKFACSVFQPEFESFVVDKNDKQQKDTHEVTDVNKLNSTPFDLNEILSSYVHQNRKTIYKPMSIEML